jgi:hypothetical protein
VLLRRRPARRIIREPIFLIPVGFFMFINDAHARTVVANRHSTARDVELRAQLVAAHRARVNRQRTRERSRWIRRVLLAAR